MYMLLPKRGARRPSLADVIRKGVLNGLLPDAASRIDTSTIHRYLRDHSLLSERGRTLRFEAERPMQQLQYDVSGSEYLYVHRFEGPEAILRVRANKSYKNKDRFENLKLWYHGMVDDCSRYWLALPFISAGESATDALAFWRWAFAKKDDERIIFRGLADRLYIDNGPLARSGMTREFFARIGVEIKTHEPESAEDTGKIEIKWRQLWAGFESLEFLMDPCREGREYTLSELKKRLINYTVELNKKKHPRRDASREEIWQTVIHTGGVIDIDEAAFDTAFRRSVRTVAKDGTLKKDGKYYFVKGLYDAHVWLYEGLKPGQMMAEDIATHRRYDVAPYTVPGLDEIRTDRQAPGIKMREESKKLRELFGPDRPMKGVYEEAAPETGAHVTSFPVRTREERRIEDPFDVTVYASVNDAWLSFPPGVTARIDAAQRQIIEKMMVEANVNKEFVRELAAELEAAMFAAESNKG
jgi:hypothetical protein